MPSRPLTSRLLVLFTLLSLLLLPLSTQATEPPPTEIEILRQRAEAFAVAIRAPQGEALPVFVRDHLETRLSREGLVDRLVGNLRDGLAEAPKQLPVSRDSRFTMASGSKMFTAVAILQLAQAGRLKLSDSLAQHLPDFPNQAFARRATLHQLLTHTAGADDYWDESYEKAWDTITQLQQMLPFVLPHLEAKAAAEFTYSNSGFILLGLVIEKVSGLSFYDYLEKHLFAPAGMKATGFTVRTQEDIRLVGTYLPQWDAGAVKPGVYLPSVLGARGSSAGGAATTVDDLLRFADALNAGKLLDPAHLTLLTQAHVSQGPPDSAYGYGTIVETKNGLTSFGHGGNAPGVQFEFKIYPQLDTVLLVMSNYDTIAGPELATTLDGLIRQTPR